MKPRSPIIVGVVPGQPDAVITTAAQLAQRFAAELVCAWVDAGRYPTARLPDGRVVSSPIDPDSAVEALAEFDPALRRRLADLLDPTGLVWSVRALAGSPARELAGLAAELEAAMIVVGTRDRGIMPSVREFLSGSVAAQLSHRQHRPIVIVPVDPVGVDSALPCEDGRE